jgi:cobalamin biosynthesis Mg chelatase CobN
MVTPKDLKSMLDQLSEAAKNGDKEAAMEMLDRMQDMLENLRSAEKSRDSGQAARNRKAMRDIDKLMREQQKLRDDTFAHQRSEPSEPDPPPRQRGADGKNQQQGKGRQGAPARPGSQGGQTGADQDGSAGNQGDTSQPRRLDHRQKQLRDQLESLQQRATPPGGEAPKGLSEADEAMRDAEQALRKGDDEGAMEAEGRALEGLRKGASEMSAQAQQGSPGDNEGEKDGGMRGQSGEGPFGQASRRNNVDATAAQKARKVLDELRRRLSDPNRARDELDYLERLIKPD